MRALGRFVRFLDVQKLNNQDYKYRIDRDFKIFRIVLGGSEV